MAHRPSAHLFCAVIDHFGDAGIAWQLATGLACDHGFNVILYIDHVDTLEKLAPDYRQKEHIAVKESRNPDITSGADVPNLVIEVLSGCAPLSYIKEMAHAKIPPVWMIYEYLSAESWVKACHLSPSPHPDVPLRRYFFYPGFETGTGGVLFRSACLVPPDPQLEKSNLPLRVSLFCYKNEQIFPLLDVFTENERGIVLSVPEGEIKNSVKYFLEKNSKNMKNRNLAGPFSVEFKPFLPRSSFETYLSAHHVNFVRGEESLASAVMAGLPFVWHIYPQDEGTHLGKLEAFCALYTKGLAEGPASAFWAMNRAWNDKNCCVKSAWQNYQAHLPEITAHARAFSLRVQKQGSALKNLVDFYHKR